MPKLSVCSRDLFRIRNLVFGVKRMKTILITVLLVMTIIGIYSETVGGPNGSQKRVQETGGLMNVTIQRISP